MFRATAPARSKILTWLDFAVGEIQQANFPSRVANYDVPLGFGLVLERAKPLRMYIKAKYEIAIAPDATVFVAVGLGAAGHKTVQSTRAANPFPTTEHPDLAAFISSDAGVTWTKTPITNANFVTGVITITKVPGTNRVKVFFLPGTGEIQLFGYRPVGSDITGGKIFGKPFRDLHETDQSNDRSAMQLSTANDVPLISQFRISLEVRSNSLVEWSADAQHDLMIPTKFAPIEIDDIQASNVAVEKALRGGNF